MVCQQLTILVMFNTHFRTRQSHESCGCKNDKLQLRCTVANLRVLYDLQLFNYYSTRSVCFVCKYSSFLQYNFTNSLSWWPHGLRPLACWDCGVWIPPGHGCMSLVGVVCCQVEVSAPVRSLLQMGRVRVCLSVITCNKNLMHLRWVGIEGRLRKKQISSIFQLRSQVRKYCHSAT
jgi:hypothetical protein